MRMVGLASVALRTGAVDDGVNPISFSPEGMLQRWRTGRDQYLR